MISSLKSDIRNLSIILKYCERLPVLAQRFGDYDDFLKDWAYQMLVSKDVEVIAESIQNLSDGLKSLHPDIPWEQIRGMRNRMTHNYEGTNFTILWDAINDDIPVLYERCLSIMQELDADAPAERGAWLDYGVPKNNPDETEPLLDRG